MLNLREEWPFKFADCDKCTLTNEREVPWYFPSNQQWKVLFVGMGPGKDEAVANNPVNRQPFIGAAGKMQYSLMKSVGLDKRRCAFTNIVSCQLPNDREPTQMEVSCCYERLKAEIHHAKPTLIVALGGPAVRCLTGETKKITHSRGTFYDLEGFGYDCKVLAALHPSFVRRQRQWIPVATEDMQRVLDFFHGGGQITITEEMPQPRFIHNPSRSELSEFFDRMKENDVITTDIETTGLNPRQDDFLGIAYAWNPLEALAVDAETFHRDEDIHVEILTKGHGKNVQNGNFDYSFLMPLGIKISPICHDTRLAETLLHSDMPKDLQALRAFYTNIPPYKPSKKEMKVIGTWSPQRIADMGCWDVITTHVVMECQKKELNEKEKAHMQGLLIPLIEVFDYMMAKGVKVNINTIAVLYKDEHERAEAMLPAFREVGLNPSSPKQICSYFNLKDSQEATLEKLIKRGDPNAEWYQRILDYRSVAKSSSTFLRGAYLRQEDGRIHTTYKIEGTGTGRPSSEDPNLANVPDFYRQIYEPDNGGLFCECDFSQLELRVGALLGPEPKLLKEMDDGQDPHENLRREIFGPEELPRQRFQTKAVVFGTFYGRSARSIAIEYGVSIAEAERWQAAAINRFPGLLRYKKRCERALADKGYVETPFGRRRYISSITQGYNTPVQSSAADVGLTTLLRLYRAGFDIRLTVYDSFLCNVTKGVDEAIAIKEVCETPFDIFDGYAFKAKAKIGSNWYDLDEI